MKKRFLSILLSLCMLLSLALVMGAAVAPANDAGDARIDITVTGCEFGNTPADCQITGITTTIDGVEFTPEDVQSFTWWREDSVGFVYRLSSTDTFRANTVYTCLIELDAKGVTSLPTITVNGNSPKDAYYSAQKGRLEVTGRFDPFTMITIDAPDVVCAKQDCKFTVTPVEGVTCDEFGYEFELIGSGAPLTLEDGVLHGVVPAEWYAPDEDSFRLVVYGKMEDGTEVSASKIVTLSRDHVYINGICGCGAAQYYTITYAPGAYGTGSIAAGTKAPGEDFILSSETFTRDGYVQIGWSYDEESAWEAYSLGDTYDIDANVTLYPVWDKIVTMTVPFTTTVALGGNTAPGETVFTLKVVGANAPEERYADVTVSAAVTTNGAGSYAGTMTLTGPFRQLRSMLCEGAFVQQVNAGEANWTYDDTVWGLLLNGIPQALVNDEMMDDEMPAYSLLILPVTSEETEDGVHYTLQWEADPVEQMQFTNTYTKSVTKPAEPTPPAESKPDTGATQSPQTGDSRNVTPWLVLLLVSAAGVVGTGVYSKRRRNSRVK